MALQYSLVQQEADAIKAVCDDVVRVFARVNTMLEHNSDLAIDWGAGATPAYITEEANGNLSGRTFTRQQVANAIGSLDQIRRLLTNLAASQGDHLGNFNLLANP